MSLLAAFHALMRLFKLFPGLTLRLSEQIQSPFPMLIELLKPCSVLGILSAHRALGSVGFHNQLKFFICQV